jgi:hypothetical protein
MVVYDAESFALDDVPLLERSLPSIEHSTVNCAVAIVV